MSCEKQIQTKEKENKGSEVLLLMRVVVKDKDGKILYDTGNKPSKSFVIHFLGYLYGFFHRSDQSEQCTDGSSRVIVDQDQPMGNAIFGVLAGVNDSAFGIVLGTGNVSPTNTDYKLQTQLTEGSGAGQITHGACTLYADVGIVGSNVDVVIVRTFTNTTGSDIIAKECGVYVKVYVYPAVGYKSWMPIHDLLPSPATIPNLASLTIYYTLRTTV